MSHCLNSPFCFPTFDIIACLERQQFCVPSAVPLLSVGEYFFKKFKLDTSVKVWNIITFKTKPTPQDSMKHSLGTKMKTSLFALVILSKNLDTPPHSCWTDDNQDYCFVKLQKVMAKGFFLTSAESFLFSFIQMKPVSLIIRAVLQSAPFL